MAGWVYRSEKATSQKQKDFLSSRFLANCCSALYWVDGLAGVVFNECIPVLQDSS